MEQKSKKWLGRKEKTILVTMIANMVLIALRFFLADLSGSIGLEANAWHSFADLFVTTIVFVGLLVTSFGKERLGKAVNTVEHILALFVSLFIFYMGFEILESALSNDVVELRYVPFTAAGALFAVVVNYFMARLKIYVGEQTESESLKADGYHSKMDMYCSIAVLIGITGSLFGMKSLDKVAAIVAMVLLLS
ncbi:MAG: cation diffusion facilitator family transporter, partial [Acetivibrio ethanolgignens]